MRKQNIEHTSRYGASSVLYGEVHTSRNSLEGIDNFFRVRPGSGAGAYAEFLASSSASVETAAA